LATGGKITTVERRRRALPRTPAALKLAYREALFRVRRKIFGEASLYDVAEKEWTIAPAQTFSTPPSLFLPGEPEKIRTVEANTTPDIERLRMHGGPCETPPVRAFQFADAALHKGWIFCRDRAKRIRPYGAPDPASRDAVEIKDAAIAGSQLGLLYFGHWLRDDAALSELGRDFGDTISPSPPDWPNVDGYVDLLELTWRRAESVVCRKLVLFDDEEYTISKGERLKTLRARVRAKLQPLRPGARVYIWRGASDDRARRLANEADVASLLEREGFRILDPLSERVERIAEVLFDAELVVSPEGSNLSHACFLMRDGGGVLAITSPERFNSSHKRWTDLLGMKYGFLVTNTRDDGGHADLDALRRSIALFG
jgi:hypothetical protein